MGVSPLFDVTMHSRHKHCSAGAQRISNNLYKNMANLHTFDLYIGDSCNLCAGTRADRATHPLVVKKQHSKKF